MSTCYRNIIVTGASGFVGRRVIAEMLGSNTNANIYALVRKPTFFDSNIREITITDINDTEWIKNFNEQIDCIIHIAGAAHNKMDKNEPDPLNYFRRVNTLATKKIANEAAEKGAKRFIFISSIGVLGTTTNEPFSDETPENPISDYAISKYEAELEIKKACENRNSNMEFVIIRPPLVYGPGAPGNFRRLMRLVSLGVPLPFGMIKNQRSMIAIDNLIDFIRVCATHPAAANQVFLISDNDDLSTKDIIRNLSKGMGIRILLLPLPPVLLKLCACLLGRRILYEQLCESLTVDCRKAIRLLGWQPIVSSREALKKAGASRVNQEK